MRFAYHYLKLRRNNVSTVVLFNGELFYTLLDFNSFGERCNIRLVGRHMADRMSSSCELTTSYFLSIYRVLQQNN